MQPRLSASEIFMSKSGSDFSLFLMSIHDWIQSKENAWLNLWFYMIYGYWALVCVVTMYRDTSSVQPNNILDEMQHCWFHVHLWKIVPFPTRERWLPASRQLPFLRKSLKPWHCWNTCKCSLCEYWFYAGGINRAGFHLYPFCFLIRLCFSHLC